MKGVKPLPPPLKQKKNISSLLWGSGAYSILPIRMSYKWVHLIPCLKKPSSSGQDTSASSLVSTAANLFYEEPQIEESTHHFFDSFELRILAIFPAMPVPFSPGVICYLFSISLKGSYLTLFLFSLLQILYFLGYLLFKKLKIIPLLIIKWFKVIVNI